VIDETRNVTEKLKNLILKYNLKGKRIHDANIVASMMEFSIPLLFTLNLKDFQAFNEIEVMGIQSSVEDEPEEEVNNHGDDTQESLEEGTSNT
jgi:hypothetical protein